MDFGTKFGIASAIAAMGMAIIALFAPYEWRNIPTRLRRSGLVFGALVLICSFPLFWLLPIGGTTARQSQFC